jgi:hypothetical protein
MNFEELQAAWQQSTHAVAPMPVDPALLAQVRRDSRKFDRMIMWRDIREVAACLLVAGVFGNVAWQASREGAGSWPAWVAAILPLGVGAFFLFDRWWSRRRTNPQGDDLCAELDRAIAAVEHQRWLLRNVGWWYLAPLALGTLCFALQITLYGPSNFPFWAKVVVWALIAGTTGWLDWFVWRLNQKAVREQLDPRLAELHARRHELEETS